MDVQQYDEAIVTYVDDDGYPFSYPTGFKDENGKIILEKTRLKEGKYVSILFNHITPLPSGGYTDRRYAVLLGRLVFEGGKAVFTPSRGYGWDEKKVHFVQYCEESVPRARRYLRMLEERMGRPFKPGISAFQLFFRATRLPFIIATIVPVLLGAAVAAYHGFFDWILLILTLIGAISIHLGLNMANDYFDTKLGADEVNKTPTPFSGGSRVMQYGLLSPSTVISMSGLFYAVGIGIGIYLAFTRGLIPILSLLTLGFLISFFYTSPPLKLAYRGLGELAVGTGFGPILVLGSYYVQAQSFHAAPLLASIPVGILIALILYINEIPDLEADARAGKNTIVVRLAEKSRIMRLYKILLAAVYISIILAVVTAYAPATTLLALSTIPTALKTFKMINQSYGSPYLMIPGLASNIKLATLTGILLTIGYAIPAATQILAT